MAVRRRHLVLALGAVAAALLYNLWFFILKPTAEAAARAAPAEEPLVAVSGLTRAAGAGRDPVTIPPPPAIDETSPPSWPRDPFLFAGESRVAARDASRQADPTLSVRSILYSESRRLAVVGGRIVRVGDAAGRYTVAAIERDAVVFAAPSGARVRVPVHGAPRGDTER